MFFVDKYIPRTKRESFFHKNIMNSLEKMSKDDSIPHLIVYGPEGSGKKTIINLFLKMLYDREALNLESAVYTVSGSGNSSTDVIIKQSNYHMEVVPYNNNFDRYLIQDVVKEYAKRVPLGIFKTKRPFKIVLIHNIDNLSYYAQTSLRRTMEKYSGTCRFIMWSRSLSKVIDPLVSRCYCIRVELPTKDQLFEQMLHISMKEGMNVSLAQYTNILIRSERNIKKALWLLELTKFEEPFETSYDEVIDQIINLLLANEIKNLSQIRDQLYKIMITNITGSQIIKDIVKRFLENKTLDDQCKIDIIKAAKHEHNLVRGRREIIHLEAFITDVINAINKSQKMKKRKK